MCFDWQVFILEGFLLKTIPFVLSERLLFKKKKKKKILAVSRRGWFVFRCQWLWRFHSISCNPSWHSFLFSSSYLFIDSTAWSGRVRKRRERPTGATSSQPRICDIDISPCFKKDAVSNHWPDHRYHGNWCLWCWLTSDTIWRLAHLWNRGTAAQISQAARRK